MPLPRLPITALLALALATGCATTTNEPAAPAPVVLISLDGFRATDLDLGLTPNLARIAREGVRAEWMTPSYPSLTFPNHYTLVTGLRPDRHGVVHNTMQDAALGTFKLSKPEAVTDSRWWGGEPLWVTAERAGLPTAAMFWPGTEAAIGGVRPTRWSRYDESVPAQERVDRVLGWLGEDESTRPRMTTLYFESLDEAAHDHGPDSPQAREAMVKLDAMIGRLVDGLEARGQLDQVNLVITSDHGMAEVKPGHVVALEDMVDLADVDVVTSGQSVGFEPKPGRTKAAEARLLGRHPHHECWRKADLPARWQYGRHPRVPAIVCQMDVGWDAGTRAAIQKRPAGETRGSHGFDPHAPEMRAIFLARGPGFHDGVRLPAIDNVDVYPALARLLGLTPAPNDGDPEALAPALAPR
ncbi:ectonucleotide pyrophosphatase/phosphodiesterase [Lysobacter korlensis]|uniref:Ectonucleotide pyrophosphatase/phosphodiesterase n=1 Tax=Lysobacter korlensis TaxID=553636 RepID=A0ABV6RKK9_9GAMM